MRPSDFALPIVYCETNWIVALAFPHDQLHERATQLLEDAKAGKCEIRVPLAAMLEAQGTLPRIAKDFLGSITALRNDLLVAARNGLEGFSPVAQSLEAAALNQYHQRDLPTFLKELESEPSVFVLGDVAGVIPVVHRLRSQVQFATKDVVDHYLLAAVLHDREQSPAGPAIFMSHNKKEFAPGKKKVPQEIYDCAKLSWRDDFDLTSALRQWRALFASPEPIG